MYRQRQKLQEEKEKLKQTLKLININPIRIYSMGRIAFFNLQVL